MAEGVFGGLLGGDEDRQEGKADGELRGGADAFAVAVAVDQARHDPEVAAATRRFLDTQTRLIADQITSIEEERGVRLRSLYGQALEGQLRRAGQRLRLGTQLLLTVIAALIVAGLVLMLIDAFRSRSVIVEPFDAPPVLAARGLSGRVVAGALLDELVRLQEATQSSHVKRNLSSAWSGEIAVKVPETGISIGELDRLLKARFGSDVHIGGDLVQMDTGDLALTVRGDGVPAKVFTAPAGDLRKLTTAAAEYVFGQSEPGLFAAYLGTTGRNAEAVAFSKAAYNTLNAEDRPYVLNAWANAAGNLGAPPQETLSLYRQALKLKPDYWAAYNNVMNSEWALGDEEGAWQTGTAMREAAGGRPGKAPERFYQNWDVLTWNLQEWRKAQVSDAASHSGFGAGAAPFAPGIADVDVRLHDLADASFQLQTAQTDARDPVVAAMTHFVQGRIAAESGDTARAAAEMEAFGKAYADPQVSENYPGYSCWIAPAEEAAGLSAKADAVLAGAGHFTDCARFRADILDRRGDWTAAQRGYADAVAIAPDLPASYYSWGLALARHGDLKGAVEKLQAAHVRGPNWADPLKALGDVYLQQGRRQDASMMYDEAMKFAPDWRALRSARGKLTN